MTLFRRIISKLNKLSIGYQLVIHFMLISILPSVGLGILVGYSIDGLIKKQVRESTNQVISKVNDTIEFYVGNVQNISYLATTNPQVNRFFQKQQSVSQMTNGQQSEIRDFLGNFTALYPEVAGILIANNKGEYISNDMFERSNDPLTDEVWYEEAVHNRGIFTLLGHPKDYQVEMNASYSPSELVSAARAIIDPKTKQALGVILVEMKVRVIAETSKKVRLGKTGFLMVVDDTGENIYSPTYPFTSQFDKPWLRGKYSGSFQTNISGSPLQFVYVKSPFTKWTTIGVVSTDEFIFGIQNIRYYIMSFVFIIAMLGITATAFLSTSLSGRLRDLTGLMLQAEGGDLSVRHKVGYQDEIGVAGKSFNKMLRKMKSLIYLAEKQERQKRDAELRALQEHIKPHFLYNTLDTIQWMARKREADDIAEMVESLSKLFRIGLSGGRELIALSDEIEHIKSYLTIQRIRYRDKLNFSIDFPEHLLQLRVLKLILQPVVENAIYHGIKERRGPGHIHLSAAIDGDQLQLIVKDDGKGMDEDALKKLQYKLDKQYANADPVESESDKGGYGLINVQARLKLTYGADYGIQVSSQPGLGTVVTIVQPVMKPYEQLEKKGDDHA